MYDVLLIVMDVIVYSFWSGCLSRFCGSFLTLRKPFWQQDGGAGAAAPAEGRKGVWRNGWPMWCFWFAEKWLFGLFPVTNYNTAYMLLRTAALYGVLFVFLRIFYEGRRGALLFSFVTFTAVSEISRFMAHALTPLENWLYDWGCRMVEEGRPFDVNRYMQLVWIHAGLMQIVMNAAFMACMGWTLGRVNRAFRGRIRAFDGAELRFLLLPGGTATVFCALLRIILVTMEGNIPSFLYDRYPLLMGLVPLLLILCLCSVLYSTRFFCELRDLHEEKNRSAVLQRQMESMEVHLKETERVYAGVRAMRHDMKNQLAVVAELAGHSGGREELQAYLAQVNNKLTELDFPYRTGSAVLDTLLGIKLHEMQERVPGILFQAEELLVPPDLKIRPMDLSLILGNGLDNAIEACEGLTVSGNDTEPYESAAGGGNDEGWGSGAEMRGEAFRNPEGPWIRVSTMMRGACFFLEIANSFDGRLNCPPGQEFPATGKQEGSLHGIGLQSIKSTAMKYHGGVDWEAEGSIFTLTVMLKNENGEKGL